MLITTQLQRAFHFTDKEQEIQLADPSITFSPEAVLNFYSNTYPILTTARIEGPEIKNDKLVFVFVTTMGTKG
ncbi:MAG: PRTRC system protein C [Flavisolibacter sp.]|nr:PRTRC system protein C [Flavisolibacter sp.]